VHADPPSRTIGWRLWALGPVLLLATVVGLFVSSGSSLVDLIGHNPPPADEVDIRRVELRQGEVRIHVTNPQSDAITVALVTVDDAIVPFTTEGPRKVKRLRSTTIVVHYNWVRDEQSPQWPAPPVTAVPVANRGGWDASGSADTRSATC